MKSGAGLCCEGRDRTSDLRVMSPTSYRCSTSRCLDGKDRALLVPSQFYWEENAISVENPSSYALYQKLLNYLTLLILQNLYN